MSAPETQSQAETWERTKWHYVADGLCQRCAAQAAWGHQLGFSQLEHDPCARCAPLVAAFPAASSHPGWRRHFKGDRRPGGTGTPPEAQVRLRSLPVASEGVV